MIRKYVRHKLYEHPQQQKYVTSLYLKYCNLTGFLHGLPDFMIIGFPKCGTTSLYEYLIQHFSIFQPIGKEIDYFDRLYSKGLNWYKVRFPNKLQRFSIKNIHHKKFLTGEATPRYVEHPHALKRIKNTLPNCKFIVLLRNPIDRAYSHFNMNTQNGYEYMTFEKAIKSENERIKGRYQKMIKNNNYYSWDYDLFAYLDQGIYVDKLAKWFEIFPKDQFLLIQSEDFLRNPSKIYQKTLRFLNLAKWEPDTFTFFKKRSYKGNKIEPTLRKELKDYFQPHNERLYQLLDTRYDWE